MAYLFAIANVTVFEICANSGFGQDQSHGVGITFFLLGGGGAAVARGRSGERSPH